MTDVTSRVKQLMLEGRRFCWAVSNVWRHPDGTLRPSVVFENEPGHFPTDYSYGSDEPTAQTLVAEMNRRMGVSNEDAQNIVDSSVRESLRRRDCNAT